MCRICPAEFYTHFDKLNKIHSTKQTLSFSWQSNVWWLCRERGDHFCQCLCTPPTPSPLPRPITIISSRAVCGPGSLWAWWGNLSWHPSPQSWTLARILPRCSEPIGTSVDTQGNRWSFTSKKSVNIVRHHGTSHLGIPTFRENLILNGGSHKTVM